MVRSKASSSKKPTRSRGVDFKKIKRKIGRKLPPPKNATNTQIKSKAIVLPEQSVASERAGLAVSGKGLTLRELLQQTSHHNAKTRKAALSGIRDLIHKYPSELKSHKLAIIEKLRERICDNDKVVRETLYHLLNTMIFPGLKEDITGPIISSLMAYVFNAMTHLAVDIRLMAFKFFDLIVLNYPSSFSLYAEKVLDNYGDILRNKQMYLEDRLKIKDVLGGLVHCLSFLASSKEKVDPSWKQDLVAWRSLHAFDSELPKDIIGISPIIKKLEELVPVFVNCFQEFFPLVRAMPVIDAVSFNCMLCILQSIALAVQLSVFERDQPRMSCGVSIPSESSGPDMAKATMAISLKELWEVFPISSIHHSLEKDDDKYFILNIRIAEIFLHLGVWMDDTAVLMEIFLEFIESALYGQVCSNMQSSKATQEKNLVSILSFIPGLVSQVTGIWKSRLLKAFTSSFRDCRANSKLKLACLSAIGHMLLTQSIDSSDSSPKEMLSYHVAWLRELPGLLLQLDNKHPSVSKVILKLQLRIGQSSQPNSPLALEYDNLQYSLREFYASYHDQGVIHYGPFLKLSRDCQELAICCLYYFSSLSSHLLESLAFCCLCNDLEPFIVLLIIEVLHSAYKAGHVKIGDQIGFLVTIVARFKVYPEKFYSGKGNDGKISNRKTFKSITGTVCSCLSGMGDHAVVMKLLRKSIFEEMSLKPPLGNIQGMFRLIVMLDSRSLILLEEDICTLSQILTGYLIDIASYMPENGSESMHPDQDIICQYYAGPCIILFFGNVKLLNEVLKSFASTIMKLNSSFPSGSGSNCDLEGLSRVLAVASILTFFLKVVKLHRSLSSCEEATKNVLQSIFVFLSSNKIKMTLEKRHKIQCAFDQLKTEACKIHCWSITDLKEIEIN